jgi:serine/threonine protein kinase/Tol biopolymer transport system component
VSSLLTGLAEAVADGQEPDWSSLDLSSLDPEERARIVELRAVFDLSRCLTTLSTSGRPARARGESSALDDSRVGAPPTVWGTLNIRELVGRGRFGDVYRAWDPAIDRDVALKLLRPGKNQPASDTAVVQEARLMGRVRHPNVATIYGAAHHDGVTGLWMEFIEGRTLEEELRERGPFSHDEAARIGVELCGALSAVHAAGLVHRDVKAQNLMRDTTGRIVLGDFGTGLEVDDDEPSETTLAGTPVYLAPEVFDGQPATPQSDVYSLGVLLFHMVTGSYPVKGRSIREITRAHRQGARTRLSELRPGLPSAFVDITERALSPSRADRFPTSADMQRSLAALLSVPAVNDREGATRPHDRRRWQRRWLPIGAAGVAIAAAVFSAAPVRNMTRGALSRLGKPSSQGRQLNRVPAPTEMQFWGRPSPDGHAYTFVDFDGNLAVFDPSSGERRLLVDLKSSGAFAYESSTFSADGARIAYACGLSDGARELRIVPINGGVSQVVWRSTTEVAHPLDWSSDGQRILVRVERDDGSRELGWIGVANGAAHRLVGVGAPHATATLSPDGRYVVFDNGQQEDATERDVFIMPFEAQAEAIRLTSAAGDDFGPLWTPDGTRVLFISDRTGEPSVWAVGVRNGVADGEPTILHRNIGRVTPYGLSSDGTLYYTLQVGLVDVSIATLDFARGELIEPPKPVAPAQVGSKMNSDWSPDGRFLAYVLLPQGGAGANRSRRLVIVEIETGQTRVLNPRLNYYAFPTWSPDGRKVAVKGVNLQSVRGAYVIDALSGDAVPAATVGGTTPREIGAVTWGPDARTLLLTRANLGLMSVDLGTGVERLVFDFASEGITSITPNWAFRLSPDGRSMAYSASRRNAAGKNEIALRAKEWGRPARDLLVAPVRLEDWVDNDRVLFTQADTGSQSASLWSVPVWGGQPRSLGLQTLGLRNVVVHPDGRRVTLTSGFPGSEVWALRHFLPNPP